MIRRILLAGAIASVLTQSIGCRHTCGRGPLRDRIFGGRDTSPPPGAILGPPVVPGGSNGFNIPPPAGGLPSSPRSDPGLEIPPPSVPESSRFRPDKEVIYPDPLPKGTSRPSGPANDPLLQPPTRSRLESPAPAGSSTRSAGNTNRVLTAGYGERPQASAPIGLPGFARSLGAGVGRKPTLEGLETLHRSGYKAVVYLHAPGADVSATRELAEKKGLRFIGLPIAADTLSSGFAQFAELVGSKEIRPAYFFDDDGVRSGTLWYLYFRSIESMPDDAAQVRAAPLGLRDASGDERNKFWQAALAYQARR